MYGVGRRGWGRPGYGRGWGFGRGFGFGVPFLLGATTGLLVNPYNRPYPYPYNPYYPYYPY